MRLEELPLELFLIICCHLDKLDLLRLRSVCWTLKNVIAACPGLEVHLRLEVSAYRNYLTANGRKDSFLTPRELKKGKAESEVTRFWITKLSSIEIVGFCDGRWAVGRVDRLFSLLEKCNHLNPIELKVSVFRTKSSALIPLICRIDSSPIKLNVTVVTNVPADFFPIQLLKKKSALLHINCLSFNSMGDHVDNIGKLYSEHDNKVIKLAGIPLMISDVVKLVRDCGIVKECIFQDCDIRGNLSGIAVFTNIKSISFKHCWCFCSSTDFSRLLSVAFQGGGNLVVRNFDDGLAIETEEEHLGLVEWRLVDVLKLCKNFNAYSIVLSGFIITANVLTTATRKVGLHDCTLESDDRTPLATVCQFFYPRSPSVKWVVNVYQNVTTLNGRVSLEGWCIEEVLELSKSGLDVLFIFHHSSFASRFLDIAITLSSLKQLKFSRLQVFNDSEAYPLSKVKEFCGCFWGINTKLKIAISPSSFIIQNRAELVGWLPEDAAEAFVPGNVVTMTDLTLTPDLVILLHRDVQVKRCNVDGSAYWSDVDVRRVLTYLFKNSYSLVAIISRKDSVTLTSDHNELEFRNWEVKNIFQCLISIDQPLTHAKFHLPFSDTSLCSLIQKAFLGNQFRFSTITIPHYYPSFVEILELVGEPIRSSCRVEILIRTTCSFIKFPTCQLALSGASPDETLHLFNVASDGPIIYPRIILFDIDLSIELLEALEGLERIDTLRARLDGESLREYMTKRQVRKRVEQTVSILKMKGINHLTITGNLVPTFRP